jgi:competence protein ComEA
VPGASQEAPARLDLNTATQTQLETLHGIGPSKASNILRYREEHGGFQHPAELLRVSGIGHATFNGLCRQIEANGIIGCNEEGTIASIPSSVALPAVEDDGRLNINLAFEEELQILPSIGPVLAERIVAYRVTHGPFQTVEGVDDVRGIGPSTLDGLIDFITVQTDLNAATAAMLGQLGVPAETAQAVIDHRDDSGPFDSLDDLTEVEGVDEALLNQVRPLLYVTPP